MARQETTGESVNRLGRFAGATKDETKKKQPDMVGRIQQFARDEQARKKKEEEEKKKKAAAPVNTAPQEGFLTRMYKKYVTGETK